MGKQTVFACPECDSSKEINQRTHHPDPRERWRCQVCGATFAEPHRREPQHSTRGGLAPGAQVLFDAEPEEYP